MNHKNSNFVTVLAPIVRRRIRQPAHRKSGDNRLVRIICFEPALRSTSVSDRNLKTAASHRQKLFHFRLRQFRGRFLVLNPQLFSALNCNNKCRSSNKKGVKAIGLKPSRNRAKNLIYAKVVFRRWGCDKTYRTRHKNSKSELETLLTLLKDLLDVVSNKLNTGEPLWILRDIR